MTSYPAPRLDEASAAALRHDLQAADYSVEGIGAVLGPMASAALHREQPLAAKRVLAVSGAPSALLVRLFTLGEATSGQALERVFTHLGLDGLRAAGLVVADAADSSQFIATCDIRPYGDETHSWWLASDLSEIAVQGPLEPDHVLGIGGASTTLARWTPRRTVDTALDLGTGCGVQAVHLGGHARKIVATDLAERALAFVKFNAALNELALDIRAGSMLEPVAGEQFDLIVSNPPFVITPRRASVTEYEYRDGGLVGDAVVRELVQEISANLAPGGVAQFLGNWEMKAGQTLDDVWNEWLDGVELDAWVIQREVQDPCEYAELWARDGGALPGSAQYEEMYGAWLDDFASRDVEQIGFGIITLAKPRTRRMPFRDVMDERGPVAAAMGPSIDAGLSAREWLAEHTDAELLDTAWLAAPDVTEERHSKPGATDPSVIMIRQGGGLGLSVQADTVLSAFVSVCDGSMTARTALVAIASLVDLPSEQVIEGSLAIIKRLIAHGMLVQS